jgi:glycosyltransferase involved in cell wall biosynthesis
MLVKTTWLEMSNAVIASHTIPFGQVREPDLMLANVFSQRYVFPPIAIEQYNTATTIIRQQEPNEYYYHPFFKGYETRRLEYWSYYNRPDTVVFAILAKNKAAVLPLYLECILKQTLPKQQIHLYIRTNDNTDNTADILKAFVATHGHTYASVWYDDSSVSNILKSYKPHEWNSTRFSILGKIRQDSINYAIKLGAHYFVADCDNFIVPSTLERMLEQKDLGVVAPMLVTKTAYSNFHYDVDANGYLKDHPNYLKLLNRSVSGCIDVKVVHCTYFIANHLLFRINYDDKSARYEYVIFSDMLRKQSVPQYLDNRQYYGFLTFVDTEADFTKELSESYKSHLDAHF